MKQELIHQMRVDCAMRIQNMRAGGQDDNFIRAGLSQDGYTKGMIDGGFKMADTVRESTVDAMTKMQAMGQEWEAAG